MLSAIEILNRKTMLSDKIALAVNEERIEDARRMEGQIEELDFMLKGALEAEEEAKAKALEVAKSQGKFAPKTLAESFLGARDSFKPLEQGNALKAQNVISIDDPTIEETHVPGWGESPFYTFADSLAKGTTTGDVKYLRRKTRAPKVGIWKSGQTKSESNYEWEKKTAQLETLATYVPIEEPTLKRYGELENVIENELRIGLREEKDAKSLTGDDSEGMIGVLNTTGIQVYTPKAGEHVVDSIRRMVTLAIMNSRLYPTCVCVAPQVKEEIDLLKDDNKAYLTLMTNGRVWNLPVIEDANMVVATTEGSGDSAKTTLHFGCVVYYANAATVFSCDAAELKVGTINDQFVKNQLCLRLEESNALKVAYPDAFVYCQDAIASVEA